MAQLATKSATGRYHFVVPVWGEEYVSRFLTYSLPSQLTKGNLQSMPLQDSIYHIITQRDDLKTIRESRAVARLSQLIKVEVDTFTPTASVYPSMTACHNWGIERRKHEDVAYVFSCADTVFGANSFKHMHEIQMQGKRAIMAGSARVLQEEFLPVLQGLVREGAIELDLPHRRLMKAAFDHLHPLAVAHICKNEVNYTPSIFLWEVGNEGLLEHCFHLHPLLVRPTDKTCRAKITVDDDFLVRAVPDFEDIHIVTDSDDLCFIDLTPLRTHTDYPYPLCDADSMRTWVSQSANAHHRKFFATPIRLHSVDLTETWALYEQAAERFVMSVLSELSASPDGTQNCKTGTGTQTCLGLGARARRIVRSLLRPVWIRCVKPPLRWVYAAMMTKSEAQVRDLQRQISVLSTNMNCQRMQIHWLERKGRSDQQPAPYVAPTSKDAGGFESKHAEFKHEELPWNGQPQG